MAVTCHYLFFGELRCKSAARQFLLVFLKEQNLKKG